MTGPEHFGVVAFDKSKKAIFVDNTGVSRVELFDDRLVLRDNDLVEFAKQVKLSRIEA